MCLIHRISKCVFSWSMGGVWGRKCVLRGGRFMVGIPSPASYKYPLFLPPITPLSATSIPNHTKFHIFVKTNSTCQQEDL